MSTTVSAPVVVSRRRVLYMGLSVLMALIAVVGFWPRYFGPLVLGTLVQPLLIHIHATVFTGWLVLFFLQAYFAATKRIRLHLAMGKVGIWYGVLLIIVGLTTGVIRSAALPPGSAEGLLLAIVQDMLMFARPRALRQEPISIDALIADTAALIRQDPGMAPLNIDVSGSAALVGDREMLQVVFQNILMNAAQAMAGQGTVNVNITVSDSKVRVDVIDSGPGMPKEVREKAFNAFFTTKHRGTGLGLPIALRVVESHGGSMRIDLPPSGGTTISIILPQAR